MSAVRFRLYVAGELVRETYAERATLSAADTAMHTQMRDEAEADRQVWMIEVWDPEDGFLRFGTDKSAMTEPALIAGWWVEPGTKTRRAAP